MDDINKPETTDPSVGEQSVEQTPEDAVRERVLEGIKQQKEGDSVFKGDSQAQPEGGSSDVASPNDSSASVNSEATVLSLIEGSTGRKFTNVDDAKKYLANLNSLVGDQAIANTRKAAEQYNALVTTWAQKNGKSVEDAKRELADALIGTVQKPQTQPQEKTQVEKLEDSPEFSKMNSEVEILKDKLERSELKAKYPFASDVENEIAVLAKAKGVSYVEAFEGSPFKALLEQKSLEESKKSPIVTPSNRTNFDTKKVAELGKRVLSYNSSAEDKEALVAEVLGLK